MPILRDVFITNAFILMLYAVEKCQLCYFLTDANLVFINNIVGLLLTIG